MTSRLLLEYDGSGFAGWAAQPGARTVQAEVGRALGGLLRSGPVTLTVAGRTDSGVHAWGQVASYDGPPVPAGALNAALPDDISVLECVEAEPGFSARFDATSRAYCYRLLARRPRGALWHGRVLHWPRPLDLSLLQQCAESLVGTRDFTAFTPSDTDHVRFSREVLAALWRRADGMPDMYEFWIEADAFMRHMNRVLVGTMLEVAGGKRSLESFVALLDGAPRSAAGRTAPAHGLYLAGVGYGGVRVLGGA